MATATYELHGIRIFDCPAEGPLLGNSQDAVALIGDAFGQAAKLIVIPASRLSSDFFRLRTGMAGDMLQKFVTYGLKVAILGDIEPHISASTALRDFVTESNRGDAIWFVPSL